MGSVWPGDWGRREAAVGSGEAKSRDEPALLPIWFPEQGVLCQHGSGLVVSLKRGKENG